MNLIRKAPSDPGLSASETFPDPGLIAAESRLAHGIHQLQLRLIELDGKLDLAVIKLELRTWLILALIPACAVLLGIVLIGVLLP